MQRMLNLLKYELYFKYNICKKSNNILLLNQCIYGRPGGLPLTTRVICPVVHHNTTPTFYEEIKIRLPITLDSSHHILFTFMHISCEISKKKDCNSDSCVGYAWVPLLNKGRLNLDTQVGEVKS